MSVADDIRLVAESVSRRFKSPNGDVTALCNVSITVSAGQCVGLYGRSGSGKTTLLTLMGMLDRPDAGTLKVLGKCAVGSSLHELSRWRRGQIGYLFQDAGLIPRARVLDSVTLPMRYAGVGQTQMVSRALSALEEVGLADKLKRRVGELSGGERQRVGLARALALNPPVLICDEPTAPLDEDTSLSVARTLRSFANRGGSVVVATHDNILRDILDMEVRLERGEVQYIRELSPKCS